MMHGVNVAKQVGRLVFLGTASPYLQKGRWINTTHEFEVSVFLSGKLSVGAMKRGKTDEAMNNTAGLDSAGLMPRENWCLAGLVVSSVQRVTHRQVRSKRNCFNRTCSQ